jgi:hypothetical protein
MGDRYDIGYPNETGRLNPPIKQGSTFRLVFSVTNIFADNGAGCVIRGQLRKDYNATTATDFDAEITETIADAEIGTEIVFANGVGSGFIDLTPGALVNRTLIHNGVSIGRVEANTVSTVTMVENSYTEATPSSCILVGILRCLLSLTATDAAAVAAGKYVWDCEIADTEEFVFTPLYGKAKVDPEATK